MSAATIFIEAFDVFWLSAVLFFLAAQFIYSMLRTRRMETAQLAIQASLLRANEQSSQAALESAHAASLLAHMLNAATTGAAMPVMPPPTGRPGLPTMPPLAASPPNTPNTLTTPLPDLDKLSLDVIETTDDSDAMDAMDDEGRYGP